MHVVVLGAGVVGVTTAYYLSERGHSVTVIERAGDVATGASGGNGGQLSYSFTDAMANPALLTKLFPIILGRNSAFRMQPPFNALPARWGWAFLRQCTSHSARSNTLAVLQTALRSSALLAELRKHVPLEFSFRKAGKLVLLNTPSEVKAAENICTVKQQHGCNVQVISLAQASAIEPALPHLNSRCIAAVYSEDDEVGDALAFTSQLSQWLITNHDVEFCFNTAVDRIGVENGKLIEVETNNGVFKPDAVVVCLGAWSNRFLKPLGVRTNIYPVRGYSVTLPPGNKPNTVSISDLDNKMVYSQLGDGIRIAGFADLIGFRTTRDSDRIRILLDTARNFAPNIANYDESFIDEWGGFRPMTPNSRPIVGPTTTEGLYLNTGHGMLGWTLACATGNDIAASVKTQL